MNRTGSQVYFAKCYAHDGYDLGVVKIGCAIDPEQRMKSLGFLAPFQFHLETSVPGDMFLEAFLHMWLRKHSTGGEFFRIEGEVPHLIAYARAHGCMPFPIKYKGKEPWFSELDVHQYIARHNVTAKEIKAVAGIASKTYDKMMTGEVCTNRRFLAAAAVAVTAVKRGLTVNWPLDFIPTLEDRKAA